MNGTLFEQHQLFYIFNTTFGLATKVLISLGLKPGNICPVRQWEGTPLFVRNIRADSNFSRLSCFIFFSTAPGLKDLFDFAISRANQALIQFTAGFSQPTEEKMKWEGSLMLG